MVIIMEMLYQGDKEGNEFIISGFVDRDEAEANGIRHYTAIIVPFIMDGDEKGMWVTQNRYNKLCAKNKITDNDELENSYNLIGGHIKVAIEDEALIGKPMPYSILLEGALTELSEELYHSGIVDLDEVVLEQWVNGKKTNEFLRVGKYCARQLIPVGFTEYTAKNNVEFSYVFALPVPSEDYNGLVSADDYIDKNGKHQNIELKLEKFTENELRHLHRHHKPKVEVCDAITRLWLPENKDTLNKLHEIISRNNFPQTEEEQTF
jgi:hypothetical protein